MQFTGTPLKDAVAVLKDQHHVPIQLDEPGLRAAGASTDVPVALFCKGVPLHAVLRTILDKRELTYVIGDDALIITTAEEGRRLAQQGMIGEEEVSLGFPNPFPY